MLAKSSTRFIWSWTGFKPFHILVSGHVEQREQRARAVRARPCGRDASKSGNVADRNIARTKSSVSEKKVSGRCAARRDSATLCRRHPVRGRVQSGAEDGTVVAPSTPKIRQNVAQLNSQNLEAHRLKLAEMNKPATWAQAVQPKGPVSNAAVEQNLVVDATEKSVGILAETVNCDKVIGRSDLPESEEEEVENKVGTGNGPIWILPPADDETKKRKKKNKNKKKVAKT